MTKFCGALTAAFCLAWGLGAAAQIAVIPLSQENDPVRILEARFDSSDPAHPATIVVQLENAGTQILSTEDIWLSVARFYTPSEVEENGDDKAFDCAMLSPGDGDEPVKPIEAGAQAPVKLVLDPTCSLNPSHAHLYVTVDRISTGGRYTSRVWARSPSDFARLLKEAMPHPR
jgi:hypothetical protein